MKSKSELKAVRELIGMSQQLLADLLDVDVRSVKRWESPTVPNTAPQDAWDVLDRHRVLQVQTVEAIINKVESRRDESRAVALDYWRGEEDYEAEHPDEGWYWQMANANSRLIADHLLRGGYDVSFNYPKSIES